MGDQINEKNSIFESAKSCDQHEEGKAEENTCTKLLPYVSPRVVIRIPDIHGGLNQTVVSISDSDPCSPCDITFKDISKTLCSPRAVIPDSVRKAGIKPSAAVRKVDVINQSFDDYEKHLPKRTTAETSYTCHINCSEKVDELDGKVKECSENMTQMSPENLSKAAEEMDLTTEQDGSLSKPLTFYSSPNFCTIHWSPSEQTPNILCSETQLLSPREQNTLSNDFNTSLNTPPNPCTDSMDHISQESHSLYSDIDYKCLDMKSPPNVNIFGDGPIDIQNSESPKHCTTYLANPASSFQSHGVCKIKSKMLGKITQASMSSKSTCARNHMDNCKTHPTKEKEFSSKQLFRHQNRKFASTKYSSGIKLCGNKVTNNNGKSEVLSSKITNQNVKRVMNKSAMPNDKVSHLRTKHMYSNTSSSDDEVLQMMKTNCRSRRKVLSSCRSYREYKQLKKRTSKVSHKVKEFNAPYTVDPMKIHAPYCAKVPNYTNNNVEFLGSNLYAMPEVPKASQEIDGKLVNSVKFQSPDPVTIKNERYCRNSCTSFDKPSTLCLQEKYMDLSPYNMVRAENVVINSTTSSCQRIVRPATMSKQNQSKPEERKQERSLPSCQAIHDTSSRQISELIQYSKAIPMRLDTEAQCYGVASTSLSTGCRILNNSQPVPLQIQSMSAHGVWPTLTIPSMCDSSSLVVKQSGFKTSIPDVATNTDDYASSTITEKDVDTLVLPRVPDFLIPPVTSEINLNIQSYSYPIKELRIGTFKYLPSEHAHRRSIAVIQIRTSHCLLVYELELHRSKEDEQKRQWPFALIEIPFKNITNVRQMNGTALILEVNAEPPMFMGYRQCDKMGRLQQNSCATYWDKKRIDTTLGQLGLVPYHEIEMYSDCVQYIVNTLALSVEHISVALKKEMIIDPQKQLKSKKADSSHLSSSALVKPLTSNEKAQHDIQVKPSYVCQCTQGCQMHRCGCQFRMQACSDLCRCRRFLNNCSNPHSARLKLGLSLEHIMKNGCLVANLPKVLTPEFTCRKEVKFPCCGHKDILENCMHGRITCPNCSETSLRYSWCHDILYNEEVDPNFHCQTCKKCTDRDVYHCEICDRCHSPHVNCHGQTLQVSGCETTFVPFLATNAKVPSSETLYPDAPGSLLTPNQLLVESRKTEANGLGNYKGFTFNLSNVGLMKHVVVSSSLDATVMKVHQKFDIKTPEIQCIQSTECLLNNKQMHRNNPQCDDMSPLPLAVISDEGSFEDCPHDINENNIQEKENRPGKIMLASSDIFGLEFGKPLCTSSPIHGRITK